MNNVYVPPPNTKITTAIRGRYTLAVTCPHCQQIHHHPLRHENMPFLQADCGKGYYIIEVKP